MHYPDLDPPRPPRPDPPAEPDPLFTDRADDAAAPEREAGEERGRKKKKKGKKGDRKKAPEMSRGVETMFRTSYRMHVDLSALADSKANILISINGLIISVILAAVAPRIRTDIWLFAPTAVVLGTCLVAISCAILAARPRVNRHERGARDPAVGDNLMFFGGFLALTPQEYEEAVTETIREPERLYLGMTRDIYALGVVLDRKFRLLRLAYTVFMVGLAIGVLLYLVVYMGIALTEPAPVTPVLGAVP